MTILKNKFFTGILILVFLGMFFLNNFAPLMFDDLYNDYVFGTNQKIKNLYDIFYSGYLYFMNWGGRVPAQILFPTFLIIPKIFFNICNSLAFVGLIFGIFINVNSNSKKNKEIFSLITIIFLVWFSVPMFGESVIWLTGSITYLWGTTLLLFFTFFLKKILNKESQKNYNIFLLFLFGLIAGWTNENMVVAILFVTVFFIYFEKKNKIRQALKLLTGFFIGILLLLFAPGNAERILHYPEYSISEKINGYFKTVFQVMNISQVIFIILLLIILCFFILKIYINKKNKFDTFEINILRKYYFELLIFIFSVGAMIASPISPKRVYFGSIIYLIIFVINFLMEILNEIQEKNIFNLSALNKTIKISSFILFLAIIYSYIPVFNDYKILARQYKYQEGVCFYYNIPIPLSKKYINGYQLPPKRDVSENNMPVDSVLPTIIEKKNGIGNDTLCFINNYH
ncbi:MAG: DUF3329 domain-containing protein [Fusobacteriaceae bacterium]